jgi:hypothetical protein
MKNTTMILNPIVIDLSMTEKRQTERSTILIFLMPWHEIGCGC